MNNLYFTSAFVLDVFFKAFISLTRFLHPYQSSVIVEIPSTEGKMI